MNTPTDSSKPVAIYEVTSVEQMDPPEGMTGDNWHRYVIARGTSHIEGYRPGSLKAVTEHAKTCAEDLNARAFKGYSAYVSRQRKK